jgi:polyisoprenoid-binding protein YceI
MMYLTRLLMVVFFMAIIAGVSSQPLLITKNGTIRFFSATPIEDIKAINDNVYSSLNTQTGMLQFLATIRNFEFKRSAMQKHFNDEDYMHSEKYPTSAFKGSIIDKESVDFTKDGSYSAIIEGDLNMHGVTRKIKTKATFNVRNGLIAAQATFPVRLEDYNIKVPRIVIKKIAEVVEVTVSCKYQSTTN